MNEKLFRPFNHRLAQTRKFSSDFVNILALSSVLRTAAKALANNEKFDTALLPPIPRIVSVEEFFIDEQQRYIAADSAVISFKTAALVFVELYFSIEKIDYGVPNFNQRVLAKLLHSCVAATQVLRTFSHEL